MLLSHYIRRSSKTYRVFTLGLLVLVAGSLTFAYQAKKAELENSYRQYTVDLSNSIDSLTSKLTLLSNIGILQDNGVLKSKNKAEAILNKAIFNEDNITNLILVNAQNKVVAQNTRNAGDMYTGEDRDLGRTNWEFVVANETVINKFGEFGYFRNKPSRLAYVTKAISKDDHHLGYIAAVLRYGEMIDSLKLKLGFPIGSQVFLTNDVGALGSHFQCNPIQRTAEGYSICYRLTFFQTVVWAKAYLLAALLVSLLVSGLLYAVFYLINQKLILPNTYFNTIVKLLDQDNTDKNGVESVPVPRELIPVLPKLQVLMDSIVKSSSVDLARQVAHDIRSPLAALNIVLGSVSKLDEENRLLARHSITRIQDIANNLLVMSRENSKTPAPPQSKDIYLVSSLIDALVSEKRTQYRERIEVEILQKQTSGSYGIFCELIPSEFKRMLSNLINNSVEAISEKGTVSIALEPQGASMVKVIVKDTGKGLPEKFLKRVGSKGFTVKEDGFGLGLTHAFKTVESLGGSIQFESAEGVGTTVTLLLPISRSPDWFVDEFRIPAGSNVVVLDDDSSIHQIWDQRLTEYVEEVTRVHLSTPDQLAEWLKAHGEEESLFLVDYELLGASKTGIEIIKDLQISDRAILVTSRFEEESIRKQCCELGVKLIPKGLAGFIPVKVVPRFEPEVLDAVLIDDESLVRRIWSYQAEEAGMKLACFSTSRAFLAISERVSKALPIYVDLNLESESGYDVLERLRSEGFSNLYLATGESKSELELKRIAFVSGTVGKESPWIKISSPSPIEHGGSA